MNGIMKPAAADAGARYITTRTIPAIQVELGPENGTRLGVITRLPKDSEIFVCGFGFDDRTVKVTFQGYYFYVFLEDVERVRGTRSPTRVRIE
jgi:hypothetical protein